MPPAPEHDGTEAHTDPRAYDRGRRDTRIDEHDRQLGSIRADIKHLAKVCTKLAKVAQRLGDQATANSATAIALAAGLKIERDTARETLAAETNKATNKWGKVQTIAAAASSVTAFLGYEYITHPH